MLVFDFDNNKKVEKKMWTYLLYGFFLFIWLNKNKKKTEKTIYIYVMQYVHEVNKHIIIHYFVK